MARNGGLGSGRSGVAEIQEELDHLRICLSLAEERDPEATKRLVELRNEVRSIEKRMDDLRSRAVPWVSRKSRTLGGEKDEVATAQGRKRPEADRPLPVKA